MLLHRSLLSCLAFALSSPAMAQSPSTLDKVKASGAITVAYREASLPFSYLGADAQRPLRGGGVGPAPAGRDAWT